MNKLRQTIKLVLFISVAGMFLAACSDDDDKNIPVKEPSRVITRIDVYKIADVISHLSTVNFVYDSNNRPTLIHNDTPLMNANYSYSDNSKISYSYASENSSLVEVNTTLENGRSYVCKFSNQENPITYSYDNDGYLKSANNNGTILEYKWANGNLESITSTPRGAYNSEYKVSGIANDYNLDLNTLAQWIDDRKDYTEVMNTLGQMAGILGKRSSHIIEDTYYMYDYSFNQDGRLKDMTLIRSNAVGYSFRFSYDDNYIE